MDAASVPPGGGHHDRGEPQHANVGNVGEVRQQEHEGKDSQKSYSDRLKTNVRYDQRLKRNVLEIALEKTNNEVESINVRDEDLARIFKTLGIDIVAQVQGTQVHYKGKYSIISVWMAPGVQLDKYCKDVSIKVSPGVMTGMIRPAGKKDVTLSIDGLDFNTPDKFVIDYLNKFGVVLSNTVLYTKHEAGPLKGKFNGGRKFQVDFSKSSRQMGTFHIIDGYKVRIFYRGNKKTCGRCHKVATLCPGEAVAKNCAVGGGARIFLSDHMKQLWHEVGFVPVTFELDDDDKTVDDIEQAAKDAPVMETVKLPPTIIRQEPNDRDIEHLDGITVRNLPTDLSENDIMTFLINYGMPIDLSREHVNINKGDRNTMVMVDGLCSKDVQTMFNSIHFPETKQKFFENVPLYCKTIRKMTPKKKTEAASDNKKDENMEDPIAKEVALKPIDEEVVVQNDQIQTEDTKTDDNKETVDVETTDVETEPTKTPKLGTQPKPKIPGLEEKDRLRAEKKVRKKKNKEKKKKEEKLACNLSVEDFLVSPETGLMRDKTENFVFSDYTSDHDESDISDSDDEFEDSKEALSDIEKAPETSDPFTPVTLKLKSSFARNLHAKSMSRPSSTSTPGGKRSASSPADSKEKKEKKKSRGRSKSQIPKKK